MENKHILHYMYFRPCLGSGHQSPTPSSENQHPEARLLCRKQHSEDTIYSGNDIVTSQFGSRCRVVCGLIVSLRSGFWVCLDLLVVSKVMYNSWKHCPPAESRTRDSTAVPNRRNSP